METNRTSSFPAETEIPTNEGYRAAYICATILALVVGLLVATALTDRGAIYVLTLASCAIVIAGCFAQTLHAARAKTNARVAAYHERNPDVELLHGP